MQKAILLLQCPDRKGIVAAVSGMLLRFDANILTSDQHSTAPEGGTFFMRVSFVYKKDPERRAQFEEECAMLACDLDGTIATHYDDTTLRMGILVSKYDHCLVDLLHRHHSGELCVDIPFIISNHPDAAHVAQSYGIPFHHLPVKKATKLNQEQAILDHVRDSTDFLVLARYMQILTDGFLAAYGKPVINIHHSFLPSFKGANPYRQAYERGVKVIGATAHYATADLDEGPIIEQVVERVSHRDTPDDLKRKGANLEKMALANAVRAHIEHRIIRYANKTVVFE
jgi:formyltetrahydrofolate deformylase